MDRSDTSTDEYVVTADAQMLRENPLYARLFQLASRDPQGIAVQNGRRSTYAQLFAFLQSNPYPFADVKTGLGAA